MSRSFQLIQALNCGHFFKPTIHSYVAAAGLIQVEEVPAECGLVVETAEGTFEVVKRPKKRQVHLTPHHFMNLVLKPGWMAPELIAV